MLPFFLKVQKFGFNVYSFLMVSILIQVFLRNTLMINDIPSFDYVHRVLLLDKPFEEFILSALIYLIASVLVVASYIFAFKHGTNYVSSLRVVNVNPSKSSMVIWCCILIFISILSLNSFLSIFLIDATSSYRGVSNSLENYSAHGYLRTGIRLSFVVSLLSISYYLDSKSKNKIFLFLFFISSSIYFFYAIFTSSRGLILVFFVGYFAIQSFYNKLTTSKMIIGFSAIVFIGVVMTLIRIDYANEFSFGQITDNFIKAISYIVVNNGGIDIPKLQHLIEYVQREGDYRFGGFISNIVLLFIPRAIWTDKPVNIDTEFGFKVYDSISYGSGAVPPGIYGEFFWDFSWPGIVISAILVGIFLGYADKFLRNNYDSVFVKVCYSISILWSGMGIIGSGAVSYFMGLVLYIVPIYIIFYISTISYKRHIKIRFQKRP